MDTWCVVRSNGFHALRMIELRNLTKVFARRLVLRQLNLTINEGDFVTPMGENGVGKTTLLPLIATLSKPTTNQSFRLTLLHTMLH